jgi:uncharacterized protein (DUF1330 family)
MAAYLVVQISVKDQDEFEKYKVMAAPAISAYGGKYLVRGGAMTSLEGDWKPERFIIVEFESVERAMQWWNSKEYEEAKSLRHRIATTLMILVEGVS